MIFFTLVFYQVIVVVLLLIRIKWRTFFYEVNIILNLYDYLDTFYVLILNFHKDNGINREITSEP